MNAWHGVGNLTRDPETGTTQSGVFYCRFTVACQRRFKDANGQYQADFIQCTAWRQTGEFVSKYFQKGSKIGVSGSITTGSYQAHDVPTRRPMLEYVDDIDDYIYACLINKKCPICGKKADLHHYASIGMGRDRDTIIHEGIEVLPLCREHHTEVHTIGRDSFMKKYHLGDHGIEADKTICKIYGLNTKQRRKTA